jgi:AraC-like DNA-binding protein
MKFQRGIHYPHPPRGPARKPYRMTEDALRARRRNLAAAVKTGRLKRLRSDRESRIIKLLVWKSKFDDGPRPSERALARQLGVSPSYIHKLLEKAHSEGMDALLQHGEHVTLNDLANARQFTANVRDVEPDMLAPAAQSTSPYEPSALTAAESITEVWREVGEWKRKNRGHGRRVLFSVPLR